MEYLKGTHSYFIDFFLPSIRRKLIEAITYGGSDTEVSLLLLRFYDEYVDEITSHMKTKKFSVTSLISLPIILAAQTHVMTGCSVTVMMMWPASFRS